MVGKRRRWAIYHIHNILMTVSFLTVSCGHYVRVLSVHLRSHIFVIRDHQSRSVYPGAISLRTSGQLPW